MGMRLSVEVDFINIALLILFAFMLQDINAMQSFL